MVKNNSDRTLSLFNENDSNNGNKQRCFNIDSDQIISARDRPRSCIVSNNNSMPIIIRFTAKPDE